LDSAFKDLPKGFQGYYVFEMRGGVLDMRRDCGSTDVVTLDLRRSLNSRAELMQKIFRIPPTASMQEIGQAKIFLDHQPAIELAESKKSSLRKLMPLIPTSYHYYYFPETYI